MSTETHEFTIGCLAVILVVAAVALLFAGIFMFYGAIFGAIGAGAYWVFKLLTGLL